MFYSPGQMTQLKVDQANKLASATIGERESMARAAGYKPGSREWGLIVSGNRISPLIYEPNYVNLGKETVVQAKQAYPHAVDANGSPVDWTSYPTGTILDVRQSKIGGQIVVTPIAPSQPSASDPQLRFQRYMEILNSSSPNSPAFKSAYDALLLLSKGLGAHVSVNQATREVKVTEPDGTIHYLTEPTTSIHTTSASPAPIGIPTPPSSMHPTSSNPPNAPVEKQSQVQINRENEQAYKTDPDLRRFNLSGHKPIPVGASREIRAAAALIDFARAIQNGISQQGMDPNSNGFLNWAKHVAQNTLYSAGVKTSLDLVSNFGGLMKALAAAAFGTGRMNTTLLDIAGKHVPRAAGTTASILDRTRLVSEASQKLLSGIAHEFGVHLDQYGHPTMPTKDSPIGYFSESAQQSNKLLQIIKKAMGGG